MKKGSLVKLLMIVAAICMAISAFTACTCETSVSAKFVVDGRIYATVELNGQTEIDLPGDPEKAGYVFDGWYLDNGTFSNVFEGTLPEMKTNVSILIYAKWKECEHELSDWVLAEAPTCEDDGKEVQTCSICGLQNVRAIAATGHVEVIDAAVEATCTKAGLTEGKHCATCEKVLVKQKVVKALGHTAVLDKGYAATCTEKGLTDGKHCSTCGEILTAQKDIPAKGHKEVIDNAVAATCTKTGLTEGKHCSVCEKVLTAQTVIPAKGHQYGDVKYVWNKTYTECTATRTCEINCKEEGNTQTVAATVKATISQPQTCETPEKTTYTATFAEDWATEQKIENVQTKPVLGHAYTKQTLNYKATDATCVKQATYYYSCKNCGKSSQGTAKEATFAYGDYAAHDYVKVGAMPYTCYTNGYKEHYKCSVCSDYLDADEKPATWTEIELKAKHLNLVHHEAVLPDGENPGHTAYDECTICGYTTKVEISAEHKSLQKVPGYAPTCTTDGRYDFYICNDPGCGYTTWNKNITIPALGHDYKLDTTKGVDGYVWSADHKTCTVYGICQREGCTDETTEHVKAINATVAWKVTKTATCLTAEETTFTPTFSVAWASSKAVVVETNPALGHDYGKTTYVWSNNNTVCTATHVCERVGCADKVKGHTQTATATITHSITQNATCLKPELTTYTATFDKMLYPWAENQTKENVQTKDAKGHSLTATEANAATCTKPGNIAYWTCGTCGGLFTDANGNTALTDLDHDGIVDEDDAITDKKGHDLTETKANAATCTKPGNIAYWTCGTCGGLFTDANGNTALTNKNDDAIVDVNDTVTPAKGHDFTQQKAEDKYLKSAATCHEHAVYYKSCATCGESSKGIDEEATFSFGPTLPHNYENATVTYTWNETNTECTASRNCQNKGCTFEETQGVSTSSKTTAATCVSKAKTTYTAPLGGLGWAENQTKDVESGEPLGHDYDTTTYAWKEGYTECTATHTCKREGCTDKDEGHTETATTTSVTSKVTQEKSCLKDELTTYTATFSVAWACKYEDKVKTADHLGHDYGDTKYEWNETNTECTAIRTCKRNCDELGPDDRGTVSVPEENIKITQKQTCTLPELTTYTANFDGLGWATTQDVKDVKTKDALGHVDENKDHACDRENCNATVGEHKAAEGSHVCDYCKQTVSNHTGGTATCTEKATCTICGDKYGEYATHAYGDLVPEDPASCTETGTEAHYQCSVCKAYFDADKNATTLDDLTIKALGHKDEDVKDNVCDTCNCLLENITISDYATANNWTNSTKYTTIETNSGVTITANGGDNTGKYYTNGNNWRIYQNENPAITFTASNCTLVTVKITYTISNAGVLTLGDKQIASGTTVTVSGNTITFGVGNTGTADNGQVRITAIQIAYTVSDQQKVDKIANAFTALTYETISAAGYTLPATSDEATITWSSNNAAIVIAEDGTVTINNGEQSVDVTLTATFTLTGENGQEVTASKDYTIEVPTKGKYSVKNSENSSGNATVQFCGADGNYDQTELSIYAGEFTFKVTVSDPDYAIDTVKINGSAITPDDNDIYTYNVTNANIEVLVTTKRIKGTQENPYTAKEALAILENLGDETSEKVYVIGYIKEITSTTQNNFKFVDKLTDTNALTVFKATLADGVTIYQNDKVLVSGYLMMFGTTPELAYSGSNNAKVESVAERGTSTITYTGTDKVTISGDTSGTNGEEFTFTLTLAEGYKVTSVKVNGELVTAGEDGTYTATIKGNTTVEVETAEEGAAEPTSATYDFVDGKDISDWNSWGQKSYSKQTVTVAYGTIVFSSAMHQTDTITDRPVQKGGTLTLELTKNVTSATFNVTRWTSKKYTTIKIQVSTDGKTYTDVTTIDKNSFAGSNSTATDGAFTATFTATKYVRLFISNTSSQIGFTSVTVNFAAESGTEGGGTEGGETGGDTPATTYEVTVSAENATVKVLEGTEYVALDGNKFTTTGEFKIKVVAADGYEIKSVKMDENALTAVEGEEGVYEDTATANANITVTAEVISSTGGGEGETGGTTEPTLVATFDFGEADTTKGHLDGSSAISDYTDTNNGYTLTFSGLSKVYQNAYDAKGNSCLKLGTSSKTGNFTFTVSNDVTKVIIYVAAYKKNDAKIKVNGKTSTVSSQSDQGSYTAIEVDTSTTKTITFETQSGGYRCMIDKIEYYA